MTSKNEEMIIEKLREAMLTMIDTMTEFMNRMQDTIDRNPELKALVEFYAAELEEDPEPELTEEQERLIQRARELERLAEEGFPDHESLDTVWDDIEREFDRLNGIIAAA